MLEIMVMRHAKSDWETRATGDHDRPLSKRGVKAAAQMGAFLANANRVPDLAISSSAIRARKTAESILAAAKDRGLAVPELLIEPELYGATVDGWISTVAAHLAKFDNQEEPTAHPATLNRVLVTGHEPTCSALVHFFTGARCRFPTGTVAIIKLPQLPEFSQLEQPESTHNLAGGVLEAFVIPRMLG